MAENQEYEAVLAIEDDHNTVPNKGIEERSEKEITRSPQEDIALVRVEKEDEADEGKKRDKKSDNERKSLLEMVEEASYDRVRELLVNALMATRENPLLLAIEIIERLHVRASENYDSHGSDFIDLANRVEELALRLLDPIGLGDLDDIVPYENTYILEKAIKLDLKKLCGHPVIMYHINSIWYGQKFLWPSSFHLQWWIVIIWILSDVFFLPITLSLSFLLGLKFPCFANMCKFYFWIPYLVFLRDTMSCVVLVGLHFWICLEPSQLAFSRLEWAIFVFILGRLVLEFTQIAEVAIVKDKKTREREVLKYFSDRWNIFDLAILFIYFCAILPLRVVAWASSETEMNNRVLLVTGYLYGFNMMFLTFRTFGSLLETFEGVGTIQIALFEIIKDACVVVLHFIVITLAFSSTVTKVLLADNSMVAKNKEHYSMCNKTGIHCWLEVTAQLGFSLLDLSEGLDFFKSADSVSQTLSRLLFAVYLVVALILLINMLIALLSNTYQRVQDNSRIEWAFQKAITVRTYSNFHPIPVPFNIISIPVMALPCVKRNIREYLLETINMEECIIEINPLYKTSRLQDLYRNKYGNSFPPASPQDQLLDGINDTVGMVNQHLYYIFTNHRGSDVDLLPNGPQAWDLAGITVQGFRLRCSSRLWGTRRDARYRTPFSPRCPHFEIMTWEPADFMWLCVGGVFGDLNSELAVGLDARKKIIYDADETYPEGKKATGSEVRHRGDTIRVTVMFGHEVERDGKLQLPVVFTVNGSRIVPEGNEAFIEYSPDKPLYPLITFRSPTGTVLAKMVTKEDLDHQEVKSELTKTKSELRAVKTELSEVKSKLVQSLEKKLDAVLAKLQ